MSLAALVTRNAETAEKLSTEVKTMGVPANRSIFHEGQFLHSYTEYVLSSPKRAFGIEVYPSRCFNFLHEKNLKKGYLKRSQSETRSSEFQIHPQTTVGGHVTSNHFFHLLRKPP